MRRAALLFACVLGGCHESSQTPDAGGPFDPVQFFSGHSIGEAKLHLITGAQRQVSVDSMGTPDRHGGIVLDQAIREEGKPPRSRRWVLHPAGDNRWSGTLIGRQGPGRSRAHTYRCLDPLSHEERARRRATSKARG